MRSPRQSLTVVCEPVPKERPRLGANNNWYTPKKTKDYETLIAWQAKHLPRYQGPVCLNVTFYCSPNSKSDLDNLIKSCLDGLQKGGALVDDLQVVQIIACRMIENKRPRMELSLVAMDEVRPLMP